MSRTFRTMMHLGASLVLCCAGSAMAQGPPTPKPTPEHQRLHDEVGTWDATIKSWEQGPEGEPSESKGVEVVKLQPGGLWILSEFEGKFAGMTFHGAGHTGYDTHKKKYVGTWVDSMSSSLMTTEGDYDEASKTLTSYSKGTDPAGRPYEMKTVQVHKDKDHRVFTMSMKMDETKGEFVKMMEISYARREK